jgi:hypothetical protein
VRPDRAGDAEPVDPPDEDLDFLEDPPDEDLDLPDEEVEDDFLRCPVALSRMRSIIVPDSRARRVPALLVLLLQGERGREDEIPPDLITDPLTLGRKQGKHRGLGNRQ